MTKEKLSFPLGALATLTICGTVYQIVMTYSGGVPSPRSQHLYLASFSFLIAWCVEVDRKQRVVSMPFEFAAFMFFLWLFVLPYYLFKTRRWRGVALAIGVIMLSYVPEAAAFIVWWLG